MSNITFPELKQAYEKWHIEKAKPNINSFYREFSEWILNYLPRGKGRFFDIACGKGYLLMNATKRGYETYGIDLSNVAIQSAKMSSAYFLCVGIAEDLPFQNDSFDYVTCIGSLEHFFNPTKALNEIVRVLRSEGRALIYVPNAYFLGHIYLVWRYGSMPSEADQIFSERFMTIKGWQRILEENGLKILIVKKWNSITSASKKVSLLTRLAYDKFLRPFIPLNLSYSFLFICKKAEKT